MIRKNEHDINTVYDFEKGKLGSGSYGGVSLVESEKTKHYYAIKSIAKAQIDNEQLHENIDLERSILLQIDHPFIVKLVKYMKDKSYIFFLMEYINGRELFDVIRDIGLLNKIQTQFYSASLMLACQYLHSRKFIFRDIKPENVIVTESGFIKLIDFGTAKIISNRTSTIIGTPHYMAPEVILGQGYTFSVDFWSIAICIYEFLCGNLPFGDSLEEPMEVYLSIVHDSIKFPSFIKDKEFKNFMTLMLTKQPVSRLYKLDKIKIHPWFVLFGWDDLENMTIDLPYLPKLKTFKKDKEKLLYTSYIEKHGKKVVQKKKNIAKVTQDEYDAWFKKF